MRQTAIYLGVLLLVALLAFREAKSQVTLGTISGVVEDETKAVLPGVTVRAKQVETGITRMGISDDQGRYRFPQLALGEYEVEAELAGFGTVVRSGITLTVGRELEINFVLKVGEISEKVQVTGEAPLVETTNPTLAGLVDEKAIRDLPLNGRSFDQLMALHTGALLLNRLGGRTPQTYYSVSGGRIDSNKFLIDGTEMAGVEITPGLSGVGNTSGANLGVEAIREFSVLTNTYSAEHGKRSGGVVNVAIRSGTNQLHASIFEFHRNDNLDARNFFDPGAPPEFKRNNFGFALGGPIARDKSFFFGNYEALRDRSGNTSIAVVPDANARQGILPDSRTPGGVRRITVAETIKPYLAAVYPLPNGRNFGDGTGEYAYNSAGAVNSNYYLAKVDYTFSESNSMFVTYGLQNSDSIEPVGVNIFFDFIRGRSQFATIQQQKAFSPRLLNTLRLGFSRFANNSYREGVGLTSSLAFVSGERQMGQIAVGATAGGAQALTTLGTGSPNSIDVGNNVFQISEQILRAAGAHSIKVGGEIQRHQTNRRSVGTGTPLGIYTFASLENLLLGVASNLRVTRGDPSKGYRQIYAGFYATDDLKLRPHFTLNLGLRYEFVTIPTEVNGKMSNFVTKVVNGYTLFETGPRVGDPFYDENNSLKGFAPRIGFAWDVRGDGKTALRGGVGVFYDEQTSIFKYFTAANAPFAGEFSIDNPIFPNALAAIRGNPTSAPDGIDTRLGVPTTLNYTLTLQREILHNTALTVGYVGSRGKHLLGNSQGNAAIPQIQADGRKFFPAGLRRRNPELGSGRLIRSTSKLFYNSFQASLERTFSQGVRFKASYTLSKSIDDQSAVLTAQAANNPQNIQDPDDLKSDRALSAINVRHNFVFNYTYDLPFGKAGTGVLKTLVEGWQVSGILARSSGIPFTVLAGFSRSRNLDTRVPDRPDLSPGASNNPVLGGPDQYFDVTGFDLQPAGFYGNLGRNTVIGPGLVNFDFSMVKNTPIRTVSEGLQVQFRAEFFNLLNHANFSVPDGSVFNTNGTRKLTGTRIRSTRNTARQIQFGLKVVF